MKAANKKGEAVNMEVLAKICKALDCNSGDIIDLISGGGNK